MSSSFCSGTKRFLWADPTGNAVLLLSSKLTDESLHAKVPSHESGLTGGARLHGLLLAASLTQLVAFDAVHNLGGRHHLVEADRAFWDELSGWSLHLDNLSLQVLLHIVYLLQKVSSQL